jgi:hypothetical protein
LNRSAAPRAICIVASVMMKGGIGVRAAKAPLTAPQSIATPRPAATDGATPARGNSQTVTVPTSATTAPTDRSIPPIRITRVIPNARIALTEICWARSSRFSAVRNCGTQARNTPSSTTTATIRGRNVL